MIVVRPIRIRLEATSACQLKCPACPTATRAIAPVIGTGHLRFPDFQRLIDANPDIVQIELSNYGEFLLNPRLLEILAYAHRRGVRLTADNGANLNTARPVMFRLIATLIRTAEALDSIQIKIRRKLRRTQPG